MTSRQLVVAFWIAALTAAVLSPYGIFHWPWSY